MTIKSKRIYDEAAPDDGQRVLTMNYWPRGISRERAGTYIRILAPSRELLRSFKGGAIEWPAFERAYRAEMTGDAQRAEIQRLAALASSGDVTVMCACVDEAQCHRRLLRELIATEMARVEAIA
jgi:uncharacterized protein YeaO (DUF488 family)